MLEPDCNLEGSSAIRAYLRSELKSFSIKGHVVVDLDFMKELPSLFYKRKCMDFV